MVSTLIFGPSAMENRWNSKIAPTRNVANKERTVRKRGDLETSFKERKYKLIKFCSNFQHKKEMESLFLQTQANFTFCMYVLKIALLFHVSIRHFV